LKQRFLARMRKEDKEIMERPMEHPLDFRGFEAYLMNAVGKGTSG